MLKKHTIIFVLLLILFIPIAANTTNNLEEQVQSVFDKTSSIEEIDSGIKKINNLVVEQGFDKYRAEIRIASLTIEKAIYPWLPNEKLDYLSKGEKKFDEVYKKIKNLPNNDFYLYEFSYFRGVTFSFYPSFLGKNKIALQDLENAEKLAKKLKIQEEPNLGELYYSLMYMYTQFNKQDNAKFYAKKLLSFTTITKEMKIEAKKVIQQNS